MIPVKTLRPNDKKELREKFGFLSFQTALINVDVVGIRIVKSYEVVIITYFGAWKTGFIYEGGNLTQAQAFKVYSDVPNNYNDLAQWEKSMEGKIEILVPQRDNYVFINDKEVKPVKNK